MALFDEADFAEAIEGCDTVIELATRVGSPSSLAIAMRFKELALIQTDEWHSGLELMDEAMELQRPVVTICR